MAEMIRLRIERFTEDEQIAFLKAGVGDVDGVTGLIWLDRGALAGRVIIEQQVATFDSAVPKGMDCYPEKWVPVEVIDD